MSPQLERALELTQELENLLTEVPTAGSAPLFGAEVRTIGRELHVVHCELEELEAKRG